MKHGFRVIDSEPHFSEPPDLWAARLSEPYRSRTKVAPGPDGPGIAGTVRIQLSGTEFHDPGNLVPPPLARLSLRQQESNPQLMRARVEATPDVYLEGFDVEGIDVGVLMPTTGMQLVRYDGLDSQHALALCRVFNDYAAEFTAAAPQRFKFWAWLPPQDAELAAEEAHRCVKKLGAVGVAMTKGAVDGHLLSDDFFEPLWHELDQLGVPFGLHGPTQSSRGIRDVEAIVQRYSGRPRMSLVSTSVLGPFYSMTNLAELVFGGVLERHPGLKPVFMETNAGWLPWLLWRLDEKWEIYEQDLDYSLPMKPSEYFHRQCYAVVDPGEDTLAYVVDYLGADNLLFSTDYPHPDSMFPHAVDTFLALDGVTAEAKRTILWDNGARLYGLDTPIGGVAKPATSGVAEQPQ